MPKVYEYSHAMQALVESDNLQRGDIVLVHTRRNFSSWIVRTVQGSYWNHAAVVYVLRNAAEGYLNTFIIESDLKGVDIHKIDKYLQHPDRHDVAILRVKADWFDGDVDFQRKVRGFLLEEIDAQYDYSAAAWIGFERIVKWLVYFLFAISSALNIRVAAPVVRKNRPDNFICSGLAQLAFVRAASRSGKNPDSLLVVKKLNGQFPSEKDLREATPRDFAESENFKWVYLVKDGEVVDCATMKFDKLA